MKRLRGNQKHTEVGAMLARLRRERGITGTVLASAVGVTQGTVSKIEAGRLVPDLDYLSKFAHILRLDTGDAAELMRLAGVVPAGATPQSVLQYLPVDFVDLDWAQRRQETIAAAEARAARINVFNPLLVPGLLQTETYARHVIQAAGPQIPSRLERAVRARLHRQLVLRSRQKQFTFVLTESALLARVAPAAVLAEQVRHVRRLASSERLRIGLIASDAPLLVLPPPAFYLLDRRVYIELPHGDLWLLSRFRACETYNQVFRKLLAHCVTGAELLSRLDALANTLDVG